MSVDKAIIHRQAQNKGSPEGPGGFLPSVPLLVRVLSPQITITRVDMKTSPSRLSSTSTAMVVLDVVRRQTVKDEFFFSSLEKRPALICVSVNYATSNPPHPMHFQRTQPSTHMGAYRQRQCWGFYVRRTLYPGNVGLLCATDVISGKCGGRCEGFDRIYVDTNEKGTEKTNIYTSHKVKASDSG